MASLSNSSCRSELTQVILTCRNFHCIIGSRSLYMVGMMIQTVDSSLQRTTTLWGVTLVAVALLALFNYDAGTGRVVLQLDDVRVLAIIMLLAVQVLFVFRPVTQRLREHGGALAAEIAARHKAEAELRASETRFRTLAETAPVGIFLTDTAGKTIWVNARWREMMGVDEHAHEHESTRSLWLNAIHPDDRAAALADGIGQYESGQPISSDYRIIRPDSSVAMIHVGARSLVDENGTHVGLLGTMTDLTERTLSRERALKLEAERQRIQVLGDFIRDTSHDLRTPLTVIKTGLHLCRRLTDVERIYDKLDTIEAHVGYLTIVIDQLQEMAVLDTLTDLTLLAMDISPLLREACTQAMRHPEAVGKSLSVDIARNLPLVYVAPDRFVSAFRSVLDNARRYTHSNGRITVSAAVSDTTLSIIIKDNGIGITEDAQLRVFNRFYKVDDARGVGGGAGLGLPIAKRVMELHGGAITLESAIGIGTTVTLTLRRA